MPYKIVRLYQDRDKRSRTMKKGLTKKEAQAHCRDPKTSGKGWFDSWQRYNAPKKRKRKR